MQSNQRLVIVRWKDQILSPLFSERELLELHCDKIEEESILGNIYIGKVQNIVKNINAAFVEISDKKVCYLPLTEDLNLQRRCKDKSSCCYNKVKYSRKVSGFSIWKTYFLRFF